jgi:hypothetical protein
MDELQQGDRLVGKGDKWEAQGERDWQRKDPGPLKHSAASRASRVPRVLARGDQPSYQGTQALVCAEIRTVAVVFRTP